MKFLNYLGIFVFGFFNLGTASGLYIDQGVVYDQDIYITETTIIENHGIITGNINISCTGCAVQFQNFGTIGGNVDVDYGDGTLPGPVVTQTIFGNSSAHRVGNLGGHTVIVDGGLDVSMAAVVDAATNAASIELNSGSFIIEPGIPNTGVQINVGNDVCFTVVGANEDDSVALLANIYGHVPSPQIRGIDAMFSPSVQLRNNSLYLHLVRSVDYGMVVGGNIGDFLDSLRDANVNDKLLVALDGAQNRGELRAILDDAVRTNPISLARPMQTIVAFDDLSAFTDLDDGVGVRPLYVMSREFDAWGGTFGAGFNVAKNLSVDAAVFGTMMNYGGKYDDFLGFVYGGRAGLRYGDDDVWIGMRGVYAVGMFHDLSVFDGMRAVQNPNAKLADLIVDAGPVFTLSDDMRLTPFVGARMNWVDVVGLSETNTIGRLGIETLFASFVDGNRYDVGLRAVVHTDGTVYGAVRTGIISNADGLGGVLECGVVNDDMGWSVRFGLNLKFLF